MGEYFSDLHTKKKTILLLHILPINFTNFFVKLISRKKVPDINFGIFLYYYMRIPSPMSSHI